MAAEWLTPAVIALLGGSLAGAISTVVKARLDLRKAKLDEKRAPAELHSVIAVGAEQAVASLAVALDGAEKRIAKLEKDLEDRDQKIADLEEDHLRTLRTLGRLQERLERYERQE